MVSNKRRSATAECHRAAKRMTLNDRSSTCEKSTQDGRSSPTSVPGSTGTGKVLEPFFDDHCKEASQILRSLTKTALLGSDSKSSNSCWHRKELGSSAILTTNTNQEKKNSSTISFQLSQSSAQKFMVAGSTDGKVTRVRRIQFFPTKEQEVVLDKWIDACRYTYNECVGLLNKVGSIPTKKGWFQWLRDRLVTNKNIEGTRRWLLETPKHIREGAVKDFIGAYEAALTNRRNGNIQKFRMGIRKKSDGAKSIRIQRGASSLKIDGDGVHFYKKSLHGPLRTRQAIDKPITHDCEILKSNGKFYLSIPTDCAKGEKVVTISNYCSIDPGVRTFGSVWSPDGVSELGPGFATELYPRLLSMDKLRSEIEIEKDHRKRSRKKQAFDRLSSRFQSILKDFHYRVAHHLCSTYDNIVIPVFGSKHMSRRSDRRLRTKTVRHMMCLGHAKFREILTQTAERMGKNVFAVGEEYTTKTCCNCGVLHETLGGNKTFACKSCGFTADRDIHAAFNIFLKFLKETSASICW